MADTVRYTGSKLAHLYGLLKTHKERLTDYVDLLSVATKEQLFQFNEALFEQTDCVAMGSPIGPLPVNVFMSHIEENLEREAKFPSFYRRYVHHTLTIMPNIETASNVLETLKK